MSTRQATRPKRTTQDHPITSSPRKEAQHMWPAEGLLFPLPDSFQALEDEHFFEVRCRRCGWTATFSVTGAAIKKIVASIRAHRCPVQAPRLCARCKRPIGEQTRCPFCGSENPYWPSDE